MTESRNGIARRQDCESALLALTSKSKLFLVAFTTWYREKGIHQVSSCKASAQEHVNLLPERYYIWGSRWSFSHHFIKFIVGITHSSRSV